MVNLSSPLNHIIDESFVIHSLSELKSIWLSFNTTNCKVNYMGGSKFSLEFKSEEGGGSHIANDVKSVEEGVEIDIESNNIIKSGSNSMCGEINELMGMDLKCMSTHEVVVASDIQTEDGSSKSNDDVRPIFPALVNNGENSKFEIDSKYKNEHARDCIVANGSEKDLSSDFEGKSMKDKDNKRCDSTKEKDDSSWDEVNNGIKRKPSKLDLERIILGCVWHVVYQGLG
ncbi:hypothetical protein CTI12_AA293770 [Artemisia annua]|uniref:Uncharacterized protein n=1 Tax=Artemisia annua TaxID=35608 RepID=A0A2U1N8R9_ARTAN|nr:hypothetical protein CTI12_AA293770 [Artemisia annua]